MENILAFSKNRSLFFSLIITFLFLLVLQGCAVERTVIDNRVYSSYPRLQVVVNKEFRYFGSDVYSSKGGDSYGENAFFYFIPEKLESKTIRKAILIETHDTKIDSQRWVYTPARISSTANNVLKYETKTIGFSSYDSYVIIAGNDNLTEPSKWLIQKGYWYPQCRFEYSIFSFGNSTSKHITYFEDATLTGLNCNLWWNKYKYSTEQKKDVEEFIQRANTAVTIEKF